MKRRSRNLIVLILTVCFCCALTSCRSSKRSKSEFYDAQIGRMDKMSDNNVKSKIHNLSGKRKKIVAEARTWLGTPYGYGRAEKGVACDCSGMVMSVYESVVGIKLPRNSAKQSEFCRDLSKKDVLSGDLCFFATGKDPDRISHVGIMIDDTNFIHSSTSKGVVISDITTPYYVRTFKGFGRVPD